MFFFLIVANRPARSCQLSVLDLNLTFLQSEALIVTGKYPNHGKLLLRCKEGAPI